MSQDLPPSEPPSEPSEKAPYEPFQHARELAREGSSLPQIREALIARGVDAELADLVIRGLGTEHVARRRWILSTIMMAAGITLLALSVAFIVALFAAGPRAYICGETGGPCPPDFLDRLARAPTAAIFAAAVLGILLVVRAIRR